MAHFVGNNSFSQNLLKEKQNETKKPKSTSTKYENDTLLKLVDYISLTVLRYSLVKEDFIRMKLCPVI